MTLIAHYPLDEDSGSTANDVAGTNDGTINGATVGQTGILGTTCYSFDGTDDYVEVPDSADISITSTSKFSVSAWVKMATSPGTARRIVSKHNEYTLVVDAGDQPAMANFNGRATATTVLSTGTWYHLTGIVDNSVPEAEIFVNGVLETTSSLSAASGDTANNLSIGINLSSLDNDWNGDIDEVRVYDHALTPQEVQYLYSATRYASYTTSIKSS